MRIHNRLWLLALSTACAPGSVPAQTPSPAPHPAPVELRLADGDLRVVNLYRIQTEVLRAGRGEPADTLVNRLVHRLYAPYTEFWNGYLGEEADFREWAVKLLDPAHPIHTRLAPLDAVRLDRRFTEGVDWIVRTTGHRPAGTWYIVFGPGWTDMGGLGGIGMVADFTRLTPDSAALANLLPHELTHQVQSALERGDPDVGTVLHRIVGEGFASYVAWVYAGGKRTPAEALMYREQEWTWALAHERELLAAVRPILASRERKDSDRVASRSDHLIEGAPGAGGYFLGFRLVQAYLEKRGKDAWREIYDLPVAEVVRRSGYLD
ncbi:MAG TPA: DUF2268 domain-containing putative Zn-dependent protease [Gemmatimonadales bacterium]|nr:DUF2268 domain-containing putative Zn-dependent protease [Gemmatimonadales bacterium]